VGVLLLIFFSTSTTTIVTLEIAFDFADVFGATLGREDRCHDSGSLRYLRGHRHRRHRTGHHLPQADRLAGRRVDKALKKVAQQPDQRQIGGRHREMRELVGRDPLSVWPSRGRGVPAHLRQAKTGIRRWNFS